MVRNAGKRRGFSRGSGQASFAHSNAISSGKINVVPKDFNSSQTASQARPRKHGHGHAHAHGQKGKPKPPICTKNAATGDALSRISRSLEHDLDNILHANTLAKHIDPPFAELEDVFSRLKTQCIGLATLVLHLQHKLEAERRKQKRTHPPEAIAVGRTLPADIFNPDKIKITTVKAPLVQNRPDSADEPRSIIYPSTPKPWPNRRTPSKTPTISTNPETPRTAAWAGSPMSAQMASPLNTQLTPTLDRLLDELQDAIQKRDGERIARDLEIQPPLAQAYIDLQKELQKHYPWGRDQHLRTLCERVLPKGADGIKNAWDSFAGHLLQYLQFIRDYAPQNLLKTNNDLKILLNTSLISLGDATFGVVLFPSVVYLSKVWARIAIGLDKRPELVTQLINEHFIPGHAETAQKFTFVEDAANTLREVFIKCLGDKSGSGGLSRNAAPQGKRVGIYKTGNLCLKLLFQCRKLSSATTMFVSIDAQSPPLSYYPSSQRVTYLYYLGRYLFANSHFYRAQAALQAAYDQCHAQALRHRQLILTYLIPSNICLGRFPSSKLLLRREAAELAKHFLPLCRLIASGHLSGFREHLGLGSAHGQWFLRKRLLFQLRNRCELLVWRSLARRVFIEVGFPGGEDNKTPFLRLYLLQAAVQWLGKSESVSDLAEARANAPRGYSTFRGNQSSSGTQSNALQGLDREFYGMEDAMAETGFDIESGAYSASNERHRDQSRINGIDTTYFQQRKDTSPPMEEVESVMASLIQQDLICGFLTHNNPRFAIPGAKTRGALAVGFPRVWEVIQARKRGDQVPGWVREDDPPNVLGGGPFGGFGGGGRVVNLSGARPAGAGAA